MLVLLTRGTYLAFTQLSPLFLLRGLGGSFVSERAAELVHHSAITLVTAILKKLIPSLAIARFLPYRNRDCEGLCICLRIMDGNFAVDRVRIHAGEALDKAGGVAHRGAAEAGRVWSNIGCFDNQRIALPPDLFRLRFPPARGESESARLRATHARRARTEMPWRLAAVRLLELT